MSWGVWHLFFYPSILFKADSDFMLTVCKSTLRRNSIFLKWLWSACLERNLNLCTGNTWRRVDCMWNHKIGLRNLKNRLDTLLYMFVCIEAMRLGGWWFFTFTKCQLNFRNLLLLTFLSWRLMWAASWQLKGISAFK